MMYQLYQAQADLLFPLRQFARIGAGLARLADCGTCVPSLVRHFSAGLTMFAEIGSHPSSTAVRHRCRDGEQPYCRGG